MLLALKLLALAVLPASAKDARPNFLFLLVDDLGYGDLDICPDDVAYEHCSLRAADAGRAEHLRTPRLKQMAAEGMIFTNWYAPRSICSPSRMASLTGRDPVRFQGIDNHLRIFANTGARGGLPQSERTTGEYLKELGYTTGYAGKWHMGLTNGTDPFAYAPWNQGFDEVEFFLEGSNGEPCEKGALNVEGDPNVYHMCSFSHVMNSKGEILEQPIRWENITSRQLSITLDFIRRQKGAEKPWFFQHAFTGVHVPWNPSRYFVSHPVEKPWTDMVAEVDWAVGVLLDELKATDQENTVVMISSDNGPYLEFASTYCPTNCRIQVPEWQRAGKAKNYGCTICNPSSVSLPGPLSGGKGQVWEGGVRVPAIWWWPGKIEAGTVNPVVSSQLDFLATAVRLAGGKIIGQIDGRDLSETLVAHRPDPAADPQGEFYYWCGTTLMAVRFNSTKVYWMTQKWVDGLGQKTPADFCGGTGKCCDGSPSRLCTCGGLGWELYVDIHDTPKVVDLIANPLEDFEHALTGVEASDAVAKAEALRRAKLGSVARDLRIAEEGLDSAAIQKKLKEMPNLMQVDVHATINGTSFPLTEMPEFSPYDHCSPGAPDEKCLSRFPCATQEGYKGPYEYALPDGKGGKRKCGAFRQPAGHSHFPEELLPAVEAWQKLAGRDKLCVPGRFDVLGACQHIADFGLNNIPTGKIFNEPYPETQSGTWSAEPVEDVLQI
eukprot:TRINITY_DN19463_c0_g2_i1.p1 TRINITY_DN19463_c0_g2~~TRINITY_DN19463_c0_g2_i1.p1  ORF type:complete len:729 (-),score=160.81 TRINITY_DN19463_c0_g2_i1:57-2210(-)